MDEFIIANVDADMADVAATGIEAEDIAGLQSANSVLTNRLLELEEEMRELKKELKKEQEKNHENL